MSEEEKDDWLDDTDDGEDAAGELDQSDIDALLGGGDDLGGGDAAAEGGEDAGELDQSDIDALLGGGDDLGGGDAADGGGEDAGELDQSDIDALLGGGGDLGGADEAAAGGEDAGELDQSDIDALLGGGDDLGGTDDGTDGEETIAGELDQSDIDALLGGGGDLGGADEAAAGGEDAGELDQSDIDTLLAGADDSDDGGLGGLPETSPDQEEIDRLFSELDDDQEEVDPFQAEEVDFKDVIDDSDDSDDTFALDATGNEFADEDFGLDDDMPDIPDIPEDEDTAIFDQDEATVGMGDEPTEVTAVPMGADGSDKKFKIPIPAFLSNKKVLGIGGGILALLIAVGAYLFYGGAPSVDMADLPEMEQVEEPQPMEETQVAEEAANMAPEVADLQFVMPKAQGDLLLSLAATDPDGDTLSYEVLSVPEYGKLSGEPPMLTYTPATNFPGLDHFEFRVSDGKDFSAPATIKILAPAKPVAVAHTDPAPVQPVSRQAKPAKTITSRKLTVSAKNVSYTMSSTEDFYIDWEEVWKKANAYLPFTDKVKVEVLPSTLQGELRQISQNMSLYRPDKYFGGQEVVLYRFVAGKRHSKVRKMTLNVEMGNPPPEVHMQEVTDVFQPGEMVVVDASASRDENRDMLLFSWQQIAGTPVQLEILNQEGSRVAFVVPSSFNTIKDPGPVLRLTVIDDSGQQDGRDIKITTASRYRTAVWRGQKDGSIAEEPYMDALNGSILR